jgi:uncharacterized delta-60 repeat protein
MTNSSALNRLSIARRLMSNSKPGTFLGAALLACAALIGSSNLAVAQAGSLDTTFATAGVFTDSAGETNNTGTSGDAVALQSDGKIIAAGQFGFLAGAVRLNTNGTLDTTFGTAGMVTINFPGINEGESQVVGLAIQSDGKILAAISNAFADANPLFILARLNPSGSLDTTFGSAGVVETQVGLFGAASIVLALQPDGKILLAGPSAMARYTTTGQLDSTFGTGGIAAIAASSPTAITLQPDGKILIAAGGMAPGSLSPTPGPGLASPAGTVSRYRTNGRVDTTFGISGQAASLASASAIAVQVEGGCVSTCKILVAGTVVSTLNINGDNGGFGIVRLASNGSVDSTFGTRGGVITGFPATGPQATAFALLQQTNGDIVAAGSAGQAPAPNAILPADFALARYSSRGALDATFGSSGKVTTAFGTNEAAIYGLALQTDGKIVAVGSSLQSLNGQTGGLVVARYLTQ